MPEAEPLPLRDIHLPDPIGWWPPAPGWWLAVLLALLLAGLVAELIRRLRRPNLYRLAGRELDALAADRELTEDEKLRRLSTLMRRVCLSLYPREQVAGLAGEHWLRWLDRPFEQPKFSEGPGRMLTEAPYRRVSAGDFQALFELCREWVRAAEKSRKRARKP